jgi:arginyl-tRNA synthetase
MSKQHIEQLLQNTLQQLQQSGQISAEVPRVLVEATKDKQHGDYATNIALVLAKAAQRKPRDIADMLVSALPTSAKIKKVEIAGPGFINFFLASDALTSIVSDIIAAGPQYGTSKIGNAKRVIIEFVSANPNGPMHVGHGRHGAYGAVVADLLETIGYNVHREYYVNDAGRQMDILTASVWLRYLTLCGETITLPTNVYKGEYVIDVARDLFDKNGKEFFVSASIVFQKLPPDEPQGGDKEIYIDAIIARSKELLGEAKYDVVFDFTLDIILSDICEDLSEFGVDFQKWFSERSFVQTDAVDRTLQILQDKGLTYENEGALWFKATEMGDEKDRVLQRANGVRTYFANDIAYHLNKFERGFALAVTFFGSDHHGYVPRVQAGLKALGVEASKWQYKLLQFVTLYRGGEQVQMSTRSGSFVTLRELRDEVGNDAARYFYVMRKCEQHVDFDLDLAKSKSNENPVFYVQYAHARICSVFRQLQEKHLTYDQADGLKNLARLQEEHEMKLLGTLGHYSDVILTSAQQYEPHILTNYMRDLATDFHAYYNAHQFLVDDSALRNARLALITAARQILVNGLKLIGVSTPESM